VTPPSSSKLWANADILLVLPMTALIALEAMLAKASQEQAKHQPLQ